MITDVAPVAPAMTDHIDDAATSLRDRADAVRGKADDLMHRGAEFAKEKPYVTAAVVGGLAATAAAAVYGGTKLYNQSNGKADANGKAKSKAKSSD